MARSKVTIKVGDIYEDCAYHPVKCTMSKGDFIQGISLVDGSTLRSCSIRHCGVVKLSDDDSNQLIDLWKIGEKAVLMARGCTESQADEFLLGRFKSTRKEGDR